MICFGAVSGDSVSIDALFGASLGPSLYEFSRVSHALPHECLRDGALEGSPQPEDYRWGYSEQQKEAYRFHAERFYQLFKLRFSHVRLTPYMMKLVDYGLFFMESLPVPICRFQAEGSEHFNYEHNKFYYSHTTRHGGNTRCEPLKALF